MDHSHNHGMDRGMNHDPSGRVTEWRWKRTDGVHVVLVGFCFFLLLSTWLTCLSLSKDQDLETQGRETGNCGM